MQELSGMSEAARDRAMALFRLIQPYLEHKRSLHWSQQMPQSAFGLPKDG
jgi:hypothetical protein